MPFEQRSFFYKKEIDLALMNKACEMIIGKKDFTSFSKVHTQTHTNICEIYRAEWNYERQMICFTIQANRFLRNMVRAIVGTMLLVGEKKISPDEINNIIKKKNRGFAGVSVPAKGLFLVNIKYNENSDDFIFDNQMLAQIMFKGYEIAEITCPTKYFEEASSINFRRSSVYGLGVLMTSLKYFFAKIKVIKWSLLD